MLPRFQLPTFLQSLRARILISLVIVSCALASLTVWRITLVYAAKLADELDKRAETVAEAVSFAAGAAGHPEELQRFVAALALSPEVELVQVVDRGSGRILASSNKQQVGTLLPNLALEEATQDSLPQTNSARRDRSWWLSSPWHDHCIACSISPASSTNQEASSGLVIVRLPTATLRAELYQTSLQLTLMMIGLVAATAALLYWLLRCWVLQPAHAITAALTKLARGDLNASALVPRQDEMGAIASELNRMLDSLDRKEEERQQALQALSASEALSKKLSMVASCTDNAVIITDAQGRIEWVNEGFTRISGYTLDEVQGRKPGTFLQGSATCASTVYYMRQQLAERRSFHVDVMNYHKSGHAYWASIDVQPVLDDDGELTNFIAVQCDSTARKEAQAEQQKFVSLVENSNDFIGMASLDGHVMYVNPAGCRLVGLKGLGQALRQTVNDFATPEMAKFLSTSAIPSALAAGHWSGELVFRHFQLNQRIDVQCTLFVVRDPQTGQAICLAVVARDITERRRAEARLLRSHQEITAARQLLEKQTIELQTQNDALHAARRKAEEAAQAKSDFLANMSHEIRTPMTAILGFADILLEHVTQGENYNAVQTIKRNGEHLLQIINDILDLSKIEANRMVVERLPVRLRSFVDEVIDLNRMRVQAKGLACEAQLADNLPEVVLTDPTRLRQILLNLIGNAVKFTEHGSVVLRVSCSDTASSPVLYFDVCDTGIGLSEEQIEMLFQPFVQADNSTTRRFGGTGLGLTISKRFAQMLGGDITVTSTVGQGSTFRVAIALCAGEAVDLEPDHAPRAVEPTSTPSSENAFHGRRILIAEDGLDNQRIISFVLRKAGAQVAVVDNGQRAVETIQHATEQGESFDAIVMDMQMPVMDGYNATSLLRDQGYTGPIIALTAHAMRGDRDKCLAAGCTDYTTKPIDRQAFLQIVGRCLSRPRVVSV